MKTQQLSAASRVPLLLIINRPSFFNFFCQKGGRHGSPSLPRASCVQSRGLHRGLPLGQAALPGRARRRASPPTPVGDRRASATHPRLPDLAWPGSGPCSWPRRRGEPARPGCHAARGGRAPSLSAATAQQPFPCGPRAPKPPDVPPRAATRRPEQRRPSPLATHPTRERRPRGPRRRRC